MNVRGFLVFLTMGWLILVLQSTVVSYITYGILQPELLLVILVHTGVYRRGADGVGLALSYGYLADLFSGRPFGSYLFMYIGIFFVVRLLSARFLLQTRFMQLALVFVFSLLSEFVLSGLSRLAPPPHGAGPTAIALLIEASINAGGVFFLFPFLSWLERRLWRRPRVLQYV